MDTTGYYYSKTKKGRAPDLRSQCVKIRSGTFARIAIASIQNLNYLLFEFFVPSRSRALFAPIVPPRDLAIVPLKKIDKIIKKFFFIKFRNFRLFLTDSQSFREFNYGKKSLRLLESPSFQTRVSLFRKKAEPDNSQHQDHLRVT